MNPTEQTCDTKRIDDYLDDRLSDEERGEFEAHLTNCEYCQIELQRRAAEPDIWRDAVELLRDEPGSSVSSTVDPDTDRPEQRSLQILGALAPTDDPEMLGRIGEYEVSGIVGVGGMGAVLKGFDRSLRRVVAIKVMAPHLANSGSARTRFQREARAAAAITHDNVIDTYGVAEANGLPYLVMPFARGPSLQKRIDESGPLTALEVARIGRQIASGLTAAHEQGLVHRDIKPANILLNEGIERLWITDFGVARAIDDASMTQTGVIAGTPQYMSPEQARGEAVDHRSDLFSMGSVLYTACTGRPPFRAEAAYGILRRITDTEPRPIRELNPNMPAWLCCVVERLMAKDAFDRFQSASEVEALFERCVAHLQQPSRVELPSVLADLGPPEPATASGVGTRATNPMPVAGPQGPSNTGRRRLRTAVVAAGSLVIALLAWWATEPADIGGHWAGESWSSVSLSTVANAKGWYSGSFVDENDRRGALQLEWSRFQRRYVGRWKIGDGAAGSLTLRTTEGKIRGAIALDAESSSPSAMPRLRDFQWRRTSGAVPLVEVTKPRAVVDDNRIQPAPLTIESPQKGRIVRWGDGIIQGARVEEGQLIAEILDFDPDHFRRLEERVNALKSAINANEGRVSAAAKNVESNKAIVASLELQLTAREEARKQGVSKSEAAVSASENILKTARTSLEGAKAELQAAETVHAGQEELHDANVISDTEFQESVAALALHKNAVSKSEDEVEMAQSRIAAAIADGKAKEQLAVAEIEKVRVEYLKAERELNEAENQLARANSDVAKSRKDLLEAETQLTRQQSQLIVAPAAGIVTNLFPSSSTRMVKEGDIVCFLQPSVQSEGAKQSPLSEEPAAATNSQTEVQQSFDVRDLVNIAGRSTAALSVVDAIETAVSLGRRFRKIYAVLPPGSQESTDRDSQAARALKAAMVDRETAILVLTAERDAVKRMNETHAKTLKALTDINEAPHIIHGQELNVLSSAEALRRLNLLLAYYEEIGDNQTDTRFDAELTAKTIKGFHSTAQKRYELRAKQTEIIRLLFANTQDGSDIEAVTTAEQAEAAASADLQTAKALLNHYSIDNTPEETASPSNDEPGGPE